MPRMPPGFKRLVERAEGRIGGAVGHPVVDVAEGQDHVGRARRRDVVAVASELGDDGLAVERGIGGHLLRERLPVMHRLLGGQARLLAGSIIFAVVA